MSPIPIILLIFIWVLIVYAVYAGFQARRTSIDKLGRSLKKLAEQRGWSFTELDSAPGYELCKMGADTKAEHLALWRFFPSQVSSSGFAPFSDEGGVIRLSLEVPANFVLAIGPKGNTSSELQHFLSLVERSHCLLPAVKETAAATSGETHYELIEQLCTVAVPAEDSAWKHYDVFCTISSFEPNKLQNSALHQSLQRWWSDPNSDHVFKQGLSMQAESQNVVVSLSLPPPNAAAFERLVDVAESFGHLIETVGQNESSTQSI